MPLRDLVSRYEAAEEARAGTSGVVMVTLHVAPWSSDRPPSLDASTVQIRYVTVLIGVGGTIPLNAHHRLSFVDRLT